MMIKHVCSQMSIVYVYAGKDMLLLGMDCALCWDEFVYYYDINYNIILFIMISR